MGKRKDHRQLERLMSYVLGRRPDEFGLVLDDNGFVPIKDLAKAISEEPGWAYIRHSHVHEVLVTSRGKAFILDNERIKAVGGDSALSPRDNISPPRFLYHCVRRRAYPLVCEKGIVPLGQPRIYLATTEQMAERMGKRRDPKPVLLTVHAQRAFEAGTKFLKQGEFIYMTDHIPKGYFSGPVLPRQDRMENRRPKKVSRAPSDELAGGFTFDMKRSRLIQQQHLKPKGKKKEISWKKDGRRSRRNSKRSSGSSIGKGDEGEGWNEGRLDFCPHCG